MEDTFGNAVTVYIGLGSNLNDPIKQIETAHSALAQTGGLQELAFSSLYQSAPMGPQDQPDFMNAAMSAKSCLSPEALLSCLQAIENSQGRVRKSERWGARTLDLDLLLYGDQQIHTEYLTIPHPGIADRAFVLYPLYEISPLLTIPGLGRIADLIAACPFEGIKRLND